VIAAVLLGVVSGLLARPDRVAFVDPAGKASPARPRLSPTEQMRIDVAPGVTAQVPAPIGRLEVLPPDMARAAYAREAMRPLPPLPPAPDQRTVAPTHTAPVAIEASDVPPPSVRAASTCAGALSPAAQTVCDAPELAAADRELRRAYRRALASGAPAGDLQADQDDWLGIREDAARRSPRAVASVYAQRIDELNAIAEGQ
jgi:uncharacterized protein YecT (DUF1311 family)